jgi:putative FmdB family regulatory protein
MPIYEYACPACGTTRDVMHKISEQPQVLCAQCPDQVLQRLVSAAAFRLKGGGWYETDFKGDKDQRRNLAGDQPPAAKSDTSKPAESATSSAPDASSAKPATPPPAAPKSGGGEAAA